jgi:lysophospholipase L1-like esterase
MPQLVEPGNMPPDPGLTNSSLRQIVRPSIGSDTIRVKFSNEFSSSPVTMKAVKLAVTDSYFDIFDTTIVKLTFGGSPEITMDPDTAIYSDPFAFNLEPRKDVSITIYFGETSADVTGHPGSRTSSYMIIGNDTSVNDFSDYIRTIHWYVINGIDVLVPSTATSVAILGNSITDGRGSITNMQNRWTDLLSERLLANPGTEQVGVLNMGAGGNCVLKDCLGPAAVDRYERDILNQSGVRSIIIFEGVNDIGGVNSADAATSVANGLIAAYKMMIDSAHARDIWIYGATITPFKGNGYYNQYSEACRNKVNGWIRNSDRFDAVIDFDMVLRNPEDTASLVSSYQNDGLHPDTAGYRIMVDSMDLKLFEGLDTLFPAPDTSESVYLWIEPECATVGENWELIIDPQVSNQTYAIVEPGINSNASAPADAASAIGMSFTVPKDTNYCIFVRLNSFGSDDDSFWAKMDDRNFVLHDGLGTSGWEWRKLDTFSLATGEHTLTVAHGEDGSNLDKFCITTDTLLPAGLGKPADIVCMPDTTTPVMGIKDVTGGVDTYTLGQNYPNPFADKTTIAFEIIRDTYVSLKVYSVLGEEIAEIAGKEYTSGMHIVEFDAIGLSKGIYYYTIKTNKYSATREMIVLNE